MIRRRTFLSFLVLACLAVASGGVDVASGERDCLSTDSGATAGGPDVDAVATLPRDRSDAVRITYDAGSTDGDFGVDVPEDVTVVRTRGFVYDEEADHYRYDGGEDPFVEYRIGVDGKRKQYAGGEDWIFAPTPTHLDATVDVTPRPGGVQGARFLYVGDYSRYTTSMGCHEISLVVAERGELAAPPEQVLGALRAIAAKYDVGHRYERVRIFATPGKAHLDGDAFADGNEAWVTTSTPPGTTDSHTRVVLHEYVHTRHAFGGEERRPSWFGEGLAEYYSYRTLLERGSVSPERYNAWLRFGSRMHGRLLDPATWEHRRVAYDRSGAFFAVLDARIQNTPGASLQDVVRRINRRHATGRNDTVGKRALVDAVGNVSSEDDARWSESTLDTTEPFDVERATVPEPERAATSAIGSWISSNPYLVAILAFLLGTVVAGVAAAYRRDALDRR
jgi:hypothetical protein